MSGAKSYPLEIFYDGSCVVCSNEMDHYRQHNPLQRLRFIDISSPDFDAEAYGRSRQQFMAELHARDAEGRFYVGVDAFCVLWRAFPPGSRYRLFAAVISLPGLHLIARTGYFLFARYRHLLPKQKSNCEADTCHFKHPRL